MSDKKKKRKKGELFEILFSAKYAVESPLFAGNASAVSNVSRTTDQKTIWNMRN